MRQGLRVVACVVLVAACSGGDADTAPGEAGTVAALRGEVTAVRGDREDVRTLAVGDTVFSDDTVTTGPDASVTITLAHNGASWTLGGDMARRVDKSPAWRAAKGSDEATFVAGDPDRTAAAGRHTEAVPDMEPPSAAATPAPPPAAAPPPPPPEPESERRFVERKKKGGGPRGDDKLRKAPPPDDLFGDDGSSARKLRRADIVKALAAVLPAVKKCGTDTVVKVKILIGKDGAVTSAVPMDDHAKTEVGRCVSTAVRAARFPENTGRPSVIYPFKL